MGILRKEWKSNDSQFYCLIQLQDVEIKQFENTFFYY